MKLVPINFLKSNHRVRKALQLMKKYTEGNNTAEVMEEFKSIAASLRQQ